jgi:putative peptidoglycan lipid II flippase
MEPPSANRQIARAAGTVMLAFLFSNLVGLARQVVIARAFGTGGDMEAFNAANRVAEVLFNLTAGGALASAFVPTFTGLLAREDRQRAWKLASGVANLLLAALVLTAGLAAVFAPWVVTQLLAPGFSAGKQLLTVQLLRVLLPSVVTFGISGLIMGILNSHQKFLVPALTPSMYGLGMIFGVLTLSPRMGIFGLAWGVVIGAGLHLILQLPSLLRLGGKYTVSEGWRDPLVRQVGKLMLPRLFGAAVVQLNFWVNTLLASYQPTGSLNGIVYAFQLMLMPQAAIAQSIAIAAMPTFSRQVALGKLDEMRSSLGASLRGVLFLSLPAAAGLMLLRRPIIALLYQRGQFTAESTELVAWALLWYALGLVGHSLVEVLARAFYALHDTRTPVTIGAAAMGLNVLFSLLFTRAFAAIGWMPHGGLALANSLATALEMIGLLILLRRRLNGISGRTVGDAVWKASLGTGIMALVVFLVDSRLANSSVVLQAGIGMAAGTMAYSGVLVLLRVGEIRSLFSAIRSRLTSHRAH